MRKILSLLIALVAALAIMATPASAYVHVGACQNAARGIDTPPGWDWDHDDDIHNWGVSHGWSWGGWGGYIRANSERVWLHALFVNSVGQGIWQWDTCYNSGNGDDRIVDLIRNDRL